MILCVILNFTMLVGTMITNGSSTSGICSDFINYKHKERLKEYPFDIYKCRNFTIGDEVEYSFLYECFDRHNFRAKVVRVEPKPTDEGLHLIQVEKISGNGDSGIYSEEYLKILKRKDK